MMPPIASLWPLNNHRLAMGYSQKGWDAEMVTPRRHRNVPILDECSANLTHGVTNMSRLVFLTRSDINSR
jgi:hypothetical protein